MAFTLSNGTLQADFGDGSRLAVCAEVELLDVRRTLPAFFGVCSGERARGDPGKACVCRGDLGDIKALSRKKYLLF